MIDLDLLPDAVLLLDADRRIKAVNGAATALTGYEAPEMVGCALTELLDPRTPDGESLWQSGWPRASRLRSVVRIPERQVSLRGAHGHEVRALITGRYERGPDGVVTGAVLVARDQARRHNMSADGIEVVSTVSHELRSPLTSVRGYTSLLL
ncbi:MAG TPA: PAS domain-containing protein, partial [Acidimicrobiales bacterium]